jgi:FixJ family two-component response regulator
MAINSGPVIVVEDDDAVRNSLKFALQLEGLTVRVYDGGDALLRDSGLPKTGCLVVDYYMPVMNGVDLVRSLRSRNINLPAILITAKVTDDMRRSAAQAGFCQVLEKPLPGTALVDSIRGALDRAL